MIIYVLALIALSGSAFADDTKNLHDQLVPRSGSVDDSARLKSLYILGPEDQLMIRVVNSDEFGDTPIPIGSDGFIKVPMAGRIEASGHTAAQVEQELTEKLKTYIRRPDVSVTVAEYRSQPVSVTGAVGKPGVIQLRGSRTLIEVVTEAGGLREDAGSTVTITRKSEWGGIPLSSAIADPSKQFNVARINLRDVMDGKTPQENIVVKPFDVIAIPRADQVYVVGDVEKAGNISLHDRQGITVLQALSMAGGLKKTAGPRGAKILRSANGDAQRKEVPVDLSALMKGKGKDISLEADDVLFIPTSLQKQVAGKAVETAIQLGIGILVWGRH